MRAHLSRESLRRALGLGRTLPARSGSARAMCSLCGNLTGFALAPGCPDDHGATGGGQSRREVVFIVARLNPTLRHYNHFEIKKQVTHVAELPIAKAEAESGGQRIEWDLYRDTDSMYRWWLKDGVATRFSGRSRRDAEAALLQAPINQMVVVFPQWVQYGRSGAGKIKHQVG